MPIPIPMPTFEPKLRPELDADVEESVAILEEVLEMIGDALDAMFDVILKPRLCNEPSTKPSPVVVLPDGSLISSTKFELLDISSLLMLSVSPMIHVYVPEFCVSADQNRYNISASVPNEERSMMIAFIVHTYSAIRQLPPRPNVLQVM